LEGTVEISLSAGGEITREISLSAGGEITREGDGEITRGGDGESSSESLIEIYGTSMYRAETKTA
jgi:hypothetical protein